jgi:hypothetical protein
MPKHGELTIQFRIHNDVGADVVLSRSQALELHSALTTVLQETFAEKVRPSAEQLERS